MLLVRDQVRTWGRGRRAAGSGSWGVPRLGAGVGVQGTRGRGARTCIWHSCGGGSGKESY